MLMLQGGEQVELLSGATNRFLKNFQSWKFFRIFHFLVNSFFERKYRIFAFIFIIW